MDFLAQLTRATAITTQSWQSVKLTLVCFNFPQANISEENRENTLVKAPESAEISTSTTQTLAPAQPQRSYVPHLSRSQLPDLKRRLNETMSLAPFS